MGWLLLMAICGATLFGLWHFGRMARPALELIAAALTLAIAGYAWQGSPGMKGNPVAPPPQLSAPSN